MNRLSTESSPYLRQHAGDPIDWYPWCDEAFAEARARDVPVLVSVGYSSCHWCHVMAAETFADRAVGDSLRVGFVAIKVDREELPEVDAVLMEALVALTGRGGWPMTMILDPERRPFWGGTYYDRAAFVIHHGEDLDGGHNTALLCTRADEGAETWLWANDGQFSVVSRRRALEMACSALGDRAEVGAATVVAYQARTFPPVVTGSSEPAVAEE